jgi:hypothetical protein
MLNDHFKVRCKTAEKVAFQTAATDDGMSLSEWIRQLARERVEEKFGGLLQIGVSGQNGHGDGNANFSWD